MKIPRPEGPGRVLRQGWIYGLGGLLLLGVMLLMYRQLRAAMQRPQAPAVPVHRAPDPAAEDRTPAAEHRNPAAEDRNPPR